MPVLIAMSRSGDVVISQDDNRYWLHLPPTAGGVRPLDENELDRYISFGDLSEIGESFDTYQLLATAVSAEAAKLPLPGIDPSTWDGTDVVDMLAEVEALIADGEHGEATALARLLVSLPVVRLDEGLHDQVLGYLVGTAVAMRPAFQTSVAASVVESARERWATVALAA